MMNPLAPRGPSVRQFSRTLLDSPPVARAAVRGDTQHRMLHGSVSFFPAGQGTLVTAEVYGLPPTPTGIYAMHIHEGGRCTGTPEDPFADTGSHYNPGQVPHPLHDGDLLPLFGNNGFAWYAFYTDRFQPHDIIGRTVVIHSDPDDFRTQPSGASGTKIGCGVVRPG